MSVFLLLCVCRLSFTFLILYLFEAVNDGNHKIAYIYGAILILLWYFSQLLETQGFLLGFLLGNNIRSGLAMLLYSKISSLTSYTMKTQNLGKITNLLSNDLSVLEYRLSTFLFSMVLPVMVVGISVILYLRIGWPGLVGIAVLLLVVPALTHVVSDYNSGIL